MWLVVAVLAYVAGRTLHTHDRPVYAPLIRCGPEQVRQADTVQISPKRIWVDTFTVNLHVCHAVP